MKNINSFFGKVGDAFLLSFKYAMVVLNENFFTSTDVMSPEVKKIMANPEDRKKYFDAVKRLKSEKEERVNVEFSNKKKMTLTLNE